ncbi:MAG: hypothetical protein AAFU61_18185, partial [Pseudomonadota bacterium]
MHLDAAAREGVIDLEPALEGDSRDFRDELELVRRRVAGVGKEQAKHVAERLHVLVRESRCIDADHGLKEDVGLI